ncbi:MAG: GNAT family N-acetyltransferase [Phycisphaerae bacterium]
MPRLSQTHLTGPETERLLHRALTLSDADDFFALNGNAEVMRYTGEPPLGSREEARAAIQNYADFRTVGYGRWGCFLKETAQFIGFCGLKYLPALDAVDVGFRFLPKFWGRGLATEACAASLTFGFTTLKLNRIIGLVLPANGASMRVLEKVGMKQAGTIRYDGHDALLYEVCSRTPNSDAR